MQEELIPAVETPKPVNYLGYAHLLAKLYLGHSQGKNSSHFYKEAVIEFKKLLEGSVERRSEILEILSQATGSIGSIFSQVIELAYSLDSPDEKPPLNYVQLTTILQPTGYDGKLIVTNKPVDEKTASRRLLLAINNTRKYFKIHPALDLKLASLVNRPKLWK